MSKKCDELTVKKEDIVCSCIADAYVAHSGGGYNTAELIAEHNGDDKFILLGFQLPADLDMSTIKKAELEMYVNDYGGTYDSEGNDYYRDGSILFYALPAFDEATVDYSWWDISTIYLGRAIIEVPKIKSQYYPIFDIAAHIPDLLEPLLSYITADNKIFFSFRGSDTWQKFSSKEGGYPPKLVIVFNEE